MDNLLRQVQRTAVDPKATKWIAPLLLAGEAVLCGLIIWRVPYTEIDWKAYMEQVELFVNGERDYTKIEGGTGPLVYPAMHVYIYRGLYAVTDQGKDIKLAQMLFGALYLLTSAIVMSCYALAGAPPYILPLLTLSKRLHSIYLLRLFNDGFAVAGLFAAVLAFQRRQWVLGSLLYSAALGVKMSVLLALPAVGLLLLQGYLVKSFWKRGFIIGLVMGVFQLAIATPFLQTNALGYFSRAFELSRAFLFKWTVNWRFVDEDTFLSSSFSNALLFTHVSLLCIFISTRWLVPSNLSFPALLRLCSSSSSVKAAEKQTVTLKVSSEFTLTSILTANTIGMLCARSLHYQFYSWLAWGAPFLLWRTGLHPVAQYAVWGVQEWAWNVYPSTETSSKTVIGCLAVLVIGVWLNTSRYQRNRRKTPKRRWDRALLA